MPKTLYFICWIDGHEPSSLLTIPVTAAEIKDGMSVAVLKKRIIEEAHSNNLLRNYTAMQLKLWNVSIPNTSDSEFLQKAASFSWDDKLALRQGEPLSHYYKDSLPVDTVHIAIQPPTARKRTADEEMHSEYLKKLRGLATPSTLAKEFQQTSADPIFLNHRPALAEGIPVDLMHLAFANFRDNATKRTPDRDDEEFTFNLCTAMSGYFKKEGDRVQEFTRLLGEHYKIYTHSVVIRQSKATTDSTLLVGEHMVAGNETKNEADWSGDPTIQNIGYYGKHLVGLNDDEFVATHRLPAFLVEQAGPTLTINMAIYGAKVMVDPYPFALSLATTTWDHANFTRVLGALKEGIMELTRYYTNTIPTIPSDQRQFPYFSSYKPGPGVARVTLKYRERLLPQAPHLVFLAVESHGSTERDVIVKFTKTYGIDAHRKCEEYGFAPALIYTQKLAGGWIATIMEYITSPFKLLGDCSTLERKSMRPAVEGAVKRMHHVGFVHGDLRAANIYCNPKEKAVKIIDWDWAGKAGTVTYPSMLNPVDRAEGAKSGGEILAEHDNTTLAMIFH